MTREMEERIVAMYFDNEDFEKNAKETIETLGQLKEGLNFEDTEKGLGVFEKLSKTLSFDKAKSNLTRIKSTIGSMKGSVDNIFKITSDPLAKAEGFLSSLQGYINKYLGFDIASKIVGGLESSIRSLTVAPISAGWSQYESTMDSVKTIMSSTNESIDTVQKHLDSMTEYANKTVYSLTDMTSNLGKFTNNGVELERSVRAMEGIANATADAGQGAQQASMAMYNVSQAIGVGKMTSIDWKSLENANVATQKLKKTFLEMAAVQGRIEKKTNKDGSISYLLTKDENGKALKESIELTTSNFREYLSKGWLDKETMLRAFEVYSGQIDENMLESWGITDEKTKKEFMAIGEEALEAATQVRTFSKMMDALKESAQSGWAESFQWIFGNMEEGTTLWTRINGYLDEILSKSAEARNNILEIWAGKEIDTSENESALDEVTAQIEAKQRELEGLLEYGTSEGISAMIEQDLADIAKLEKEIDDIRNGRLHLSGGTDETNIQTRQKKIDEMKANIAELEKKQAELEKAEAEYTKRSAEIAAYDEQISALDAEIAEAKKTLVFNPDTGEDDPELVKKRDKLIADKQKEIEALQKKRNKLVKDTDQDEISQLQKDIAELEEQKTELEKQIDEDKNTPKSSIVDEQGRSGRDIAIDTLFELLDIFKEVGTAISEAWSEVFGKLDAQGLFDFTKKIGDAVHTVHEWINEIDQENGLTRLQKIKNIIKGILGPIKLVVNVLKTLWNFAKKLLTPVLNFLIDKFSSISGWFEKLGSLEPGQIIEYIGNGIKTAWEKVKSFFSPQDLLDEDGNVTGQEIPIIAWLKSLWTKLKTTVKTWATENGLGDVWEKVSGWWSTIKGVLNDGKEKLEGAWNTFSTWIGTSGLGEFFADTWNWITGLFTTDETTGEMPIVTFFSNIWEGVETAFEDAKKTWNELDEKLGISAFFSGLWDSITGLFARKLSYVTYDSKGRHEHYEDMPIVSFFKNIWAGVEKAFKDAKAAWDSLDEKLGISKFFSGLWNSIIGLFTRKLSHVTYDSEGRHEHYEDMPIVSFFKNLWAGVEKAFNDAKAAWNSLDDKLGISAFFSGLWDSITGLFTKKLSFVTYDSTGRHEHYENSPIAQFFYDLWHGIESAYKTVSNWWEKESGIPEFFAGLWDTVSGWFKGSVDEKTGEAIDAPIVKFFKSIGDGISKAWNFITTEIPWEDIGKFFSDTWDFIYGLFAGEDKAEQKASAGHGNMRAAVISERLKTMSDVGTGVQQTTENLPQDEGKTNKALEIFKSIMTTIGEFFSTVFTAVKDAVITPEIQKFFDQISTFLKGFMEIIGKVFESLGNIFHGLATGEWNENWLIDVLRVGLPLLFGAIAYLFEYYKIKNLSKISGTFGQSFGLQFLEVCAGIMLAASAISLLTTLDQDKMQAAAGIIMVLGVVLGTILSTANQLQSTVNPQTSGERIINNLVNVIGRVGLIALVLTMLPSIIETIGKVKKDLGPEMSEGFGDDVLKIMLGIVTLVGSISIILAAIQKFTITGLSITATASTILSIAAAIGILSVIFLAIGGIGEAVDGIFGAGSHENVLGALEKAADFMQGIGNVINKFIVGLLGIKSDSEKADEASKVMEKLAEMSSKLDMTAITGVSRIANLIIALSGEAGGIDSSKLAEFATAMSNLGEGIYTIAGYLNEVDGPLSELSSSESLMYKKFANFTNICKMFGEALSSFNTELWTYFDDPTDPSNFKDQRYKTGLTYMIQSIIDLANDDQLLNGFVEALKKIMETLNAELPDSGIEFDGLTIARQLFTAIQDGLGNPDLGVFDATSVVDAICDALRLGDTAIAQIVHDMVQNGLGLTTKNGEEPYEVNESTEDTGNEGLFRKVYGKYLKLDGTETLTDKVTSLLGDESEWQKLMGQWDSKQGELQTKIDAFGNTFADDSWLTITDPETGEESDIVSVIQGKINGLQDAIDETEFTVHITPIFDFTQLTADNLREELAAREIALPISVNNGELAISFTGLSTELDMEGIRNRLDLIAANVVNGSSYQGLRIDALGSHMDSIAAEVAALKLYLDTGVLVGGIIGEVDRQLYNRSQSSRRTGVAATASPGYVP